MRANGVYVKTASLAALAEEARGACKDIDEVVRTTEMTGMSRRVVMSTPVGNVKG